MNFLIALTFIFMMSMKADAQPFDQRPVYTIVVALASTNVGTGAYVELDSAMNAKCMWLDVFNSSTSPIYLATGAASSEINIPFTNGPAAAHHNAIPVNVAKGVRLSARSASGTANSGFLIVNCFQ